VWYFNNFVDHVSRWGNMAQALTRRQHPVVSRVALDVLHQAMYPALYHCLSIEVACNLPAFFVILDFAVALNHS
jgi:hypothetical protein